MDKALPLLAVLAAGLMVALQGPSNGWVIKASGSPFFALAVSVGLGAGLTALLALVLPVRPETTPVLPWYAWLGGAYGVAVVFCGAWATPKLGAGPALVAALVGQTALGLALDHFGLLGLERAPVTGLKIGGVLVMLVGAMMVAAKT